MLEPMLLLALHDIVDECTTAITFEPRPTCYQSHEDVPNGLRTISHIKFSMIRDTAQQALRRAGVAFVPDLPFRATMK